MTLAARKRLETYASLSRTQSDEETYGLLERVANHAGDSDWRGERAGTDGAWRPDVADVEHAARKGRMEMKRFTAYRRNISQRDTHSDLHKNADSEPQYEGVIWSDGTVTLRWLTPIRAHSVWASLYDALAIHGHPEYGTEIIWHDCDPPQEWLDQVRAALGGEGKDG